MVEVVDSVEIIMPFSSPEKMTCYSHGRRLPDSLTQDILKQETDFSFVFSIFGQDMAFINDHVIKYKPEEGEDMLRIAIDEGITIRMYRFKEFERDHGESATPIAVSHDRLGNNVQEMIADGLSDHEEYAIHVIFASDEDDFHQKASLECLIATMQVKIANSKSDFVCLTTRLDKLQEKHDKQVYPTILSYEKAADKGKHILMAARNSASGFAKQYTIEIKDDDTDLEVTIEGSDHFYGAKLLIQSNDKDTDSSSANDHGRGMNSILAHVFGSKNTLSADSVTSPKHMTKYLYRGMAAGTYTVRML